MNIRVSRLRYALTIDYKRGGRPIRVVSIVAGGARPLVEIPIPDFQLVSIAHMFGNIGTQPPTGQRERFHLPDVPPTRTGVRVQIHDPVPELHRDRVAPDFI